MVMFSWTPSRELNFPPIALDKLVIADFTGLVLGFSPVATELLVAGAVAELLDAGTVAELLAPEAVAELLPTEFSVF